MQTGVYILQCGNGRYYTGSTDNVTRRFSEHASGLVKSTRNLLPVRLVFFQKCQSLTHARTLEYKIKKKKSRIYIERLIENKELNFLATLN